HEVALEILGKHSGTDIHDRYSAFETLASKTKNPQQYCWSHIISDAKELEDFYGEEGRRIKESLQKIYDKAKSFNGNGTSEEIDDLYPEVGVPPRHGLRASQDKEVRRQSPQAEEGVAVPIRCRS
ncbi:MAG: IS66 family transposase, partial [Candidatus Acidifodinimicrobium sp.]